MQVNVRLRERVERDAEGAGAGAQETPRRLRRSLHDVAQLAGERDLALARHPDRLDEHDVAADGRPRESGGDADLGRAPRDLALHLRLAGVFLEVLGAHPHHLRSALDHLQRRLSQHALNLALELADTGPPPPPLPPPPPPPPPAFPGPP